METSILEPSSPSSGSSSAHETPRWFLCPGATRDAHFSEMPHGTVILARDFTSVAVRPFKFSHTERVQYEVHLLSPGSMQVGWCATPSALPFTATHGVGDSTVSVGVDGSRRCLLRLQEQSVPSLRWHCGDILSCYADFCRGLFEFALNGVLQCRTELPTRGWLSAHGVAAMRPGRIVEDAMLVYTVGLSLMGGECCLVNLGEAPMRYPRSGYHTVLAHHLCTGGVMGAGESFSNSGGGGGSTTSEPRDEAESANPPATTPKGQASGVSAETPSAVPLTYAHTCLGGTSLESLLDLFEANGRHALVEAVRRAVEPGLRVLARAMGQLTRHVSDLLLLLVSWFETDVQGRWRAFTMLICLILEELYEVSPYATVDTGEDGKGVDGHISEPDAQRATEATGLLLHTLQLLVPEEHFAVLPGLLIMALQHRFYNTAVMRLRVLHVIHDLVHVPGVARVWLAHTTTFCSTALNLFFVPPPGEDQCAWLAAQLSSTTTRWPPTAPHGAETHDDCVIAEAQRRLRLLRPSSTTQLRDAESTACWRLATECVSCAAQDPSCRAAATAVLLRLMCEPPLRQDGLLSRPPRHSLTYAVVSESFPGAYALHHSLLTVNALISAFVDVLPEPELAALDHRPTFPPPTTLRHSGEEDDDAVVDAHEQMTSRCGTWQSQACLLCPQELFYMRPWAPATELTPAPGSSPALQQDIRLGGPFHQLEQNFVQYGIAVPHATESHGCVVTNVLDAARQGPRMAVDGRAFFTVLCAASTTFLRPLLAQLSNLRVTLLDTAATCVATADEDASSASGPDACAAQVEEEVTAPRTETKLELQLLILLLTTLSYLHEEAWQARMTTLTATAGAVLEYYWYASMPGVAVTEDTCCASRAFLMLPLVILNTFLDGWLYLGVAEGKNSLLVSRYPTLALGFFDAARRHGVAPVITRTYLYQAMASVVGFGPRDRLQVAQLLCQQDEHVGSLRTQSTPVAAAVTAANDDNDGNVKLPRSLPFLQSSILDCLDVYVHEDNFNDTLALNFLYSLAQENTCLLPPPRLLEESFWWLQQLRREDEAALPPLAMFTGDAATGVDVASGTARTTTTADEVYLDAFCRAVQGVDMRRFLLPALTKSNRLLTQFTALGTVCEASAQASSTSILEVYRNYYLRYTLLRKNLYLLDFFWHVFCLHDDASAGMDHRTEAMRCALMDVILQALLRIRFTSTVARSASLQVADSTTQELPTQRQSDSSSCALRENVLLPTVMYVNGDGREPRRHYCTNAPCTVTGLLAPLFSILHRVLVQHGTVIDRNPYLVLTSELDRLVHYARQLLRHPAWWATPSPASCPHSDAATGQAAQHEFLPAHSQDVLRRLQHQLDEIHEQIALRSSSRSGHNTARVGVASPTHSPRIPQATAIVALGGRLETNAPDTTPPSSPRSAREWRGLERPYLSQDADNVASEACGAFRFFRPAAEETAARSGVAVLCRLSGSSRDCASATRLGRPPAPHRLALHVGDSDHSDESTTSHGKAKSSSSAHSARAVASVDDEEDDTLCRICFERLVNVRFQPCGHGCCHLCLYRSRNEGYVAERATWSGQGSANTAAGLSRHGASALTTPATTPPYARLTRLSYAEEGFAAEEVQDTATLPAAAGVGECGGPSAPLSPRGASMSHEICFFCRAPISAVVQDRM